MLRSAQGLNYRRLSSRAKLVHHSAESTLGPRGEVPPDQVLQVQNVAFKAARESLTNGCAQGRFDEQSLSQLLAQLIAQLLRHQNPGRGFQWIRLEDQAAKQSTPGHPGDVGFYSGVGHKTRVHAQELVYLRQSSVRILQEIVVQEEPSLLP